MPLKKLNEEQLKAVKAPFGKNLIIASAGTGKTSTIVARIAYLLEKDVKNIVLLTFTNKAAASMIERLHIYFDKNIIAKIQAGTFHSLAYSFLKKENKKLALKAASELKLLLKAIIEKYQGFFEDERAYSAAYLYDIYQLFLSKNEKNFHDFLKNINENQSKHSKLYEEILKEFEEEKASFGYLDFNDLLISFKKLLEEKSFDFDELLVDEYQDTNALQASLIESFKAKSLFCVGDYDQSIYAFNGADIKIIANFNKLYKDANIFTLKKNYRSSKNILELANKVILKNERLYPKELEVTRKGDFTPPNLLVFEELNTQYKEIARLILKNKLKVNETAIIFRNNSSADGMELALKELNIPSTRRDSLSIFDSLEIKLFLALYSLAINDKDIMAFIHVLEYSKGLGAAMAKKIFKALLKLGDDDIKKGFLNPKNTQISSSLPLFSTDFGLKTAFKDHPILELDKLSLEGAKNLEKLFLFFKKSKDFKDAKSLAKLTLEDEFLKELSDILALRRSLSKEGKLDEDKLAFNKERIAKRIRGVAALAKGYKDAYSYFNFLSLGSKELSKDEGVQLLSVHAAKGLEFKNVFIIDLAQKRFPNEKLISLGGSLEEERRLFYVAVTRAKDLLYLSYAKYDAYKKLSFKPSCFLEEAGFKL